MTPGNGECGWPTAGQFFLGRHIRSLSPSWAGGRGLLLFQGTMLRGHLRLLSYGVYSPGVQWGGGMDLFPRHLRSDCCGQKSFTYPGQKRREVASVGRTV